MQDIEELRRQGLSIKAISKLTGYDRKTIRKYVTNPEPLVYGPRASRASKIDPFKGYIAERLQAGAWNARALLHELRAQGYSGGYTILTDWLRSHRELTETSAGQFKTPSGHARVEWGRLGNIELMGMKHQLFGFTVILPFSGVMFFAAAVDKGLETFLRLHENAFDQLGGVPEAIAYDRLKPLCLKTDTDETVWHPVFWGFSQYWGFRPELSRPGQVWSQREVDLSLGYIRRKFMRELETLAPPNVEAVNTEVRRWINQVAGLNMGSNPNEPQPRWIEERATLQPTAGRPPYPYLA